jgi:hypothetical protein
MTSYFYYNRREVSILQHPTRHYPNFTTPIASPYYYTPARVLFYRTRHKVDYDGCIVIGSYDECSKNKTMTGV